MIIYFRDCPFSFYLPLPISPCLYVFQPLLLSPYFLSVSFTLSFMALARLSPCQLPSALRRHTPFPTSLFLSIPSSHSSRCAELTPCADGGKTKKYISIHMPLPNPLSGRSFILLLILLLLFFSTFIFFFPPSLSTNLHKVVLSVYSSPPPLP